MMFQYCFQGFSQDGKPDERWAGEGQTAMAAINAAFGSKASSINNFFEDVSWKYEFEVKNGAYTTLATSRRQKRIVAVLSRHKLVSDENGTWVQF